MDRVQTAGQKETPQTNYMRISCVRGSRIDTSNPRATNASCNAIPLYFSGKGLFLLMMREATTYTM